MRNFAFLVRFTVILTIVSFLCTLGIHYGIQGDEVDFWCNVCLSVFGSSLLTLITSYIGYITERRKTLEGFSYSTRGLLHILTKYDLSWDIERKLDFFLDYADMDRSLWNIQLGDIYFLNDPKRKRFKYIYEKIYLPVLNLNKKVLEHEFHFKWHKDGSGKNDVIMSQFIMEIEDLFMINETLERTSEDGETIVLPHIENKLVRAILSELNGKYFSIMYSKKQVERNDS